MYVCLSVCCYCAIYYDTSRYFYYFNVVKCFIIFFFVEWFCLMLSDVIFFDELYVFNGLVSSEHIWKAFNFIKCFIIWSLNWFCLMLSDALFDVVWCIILIIVMYTCYTTCIDDDVKLLCFKVVRFLSNYWCCQLLKL